VAAEPAIDPLGQRLHFVVGKGGVGKTTVAAALALLLARQGKRTLAIEMDVGGRLPTVLGGEGAAASPVELSRGLWVQSLDGRTALEEYLGLVVPVKRLLSTVFSNRIYQYFVAAAPGLKELMTVGKIWYEATREDNGRPAWDAIVVDAPATGHSVQYLRMPQAARDTFGAGLVKNEAAKVVDLLQDARTTAVHLVTLAEEMPVAETLETHAQLRDTLRMPLGWVIANRIHRREFSPEVLDRLAQASTGVDADDRGLLACIRERAVEESGWAAINRQNLDRLRAGIGGAPLVELPFWFVEEFGRDTLDALSRTLEAGVHA
jgi:anion-transporting  ArsA/GET3 family ATPase